MTAPAAPAMSSGLFEWQHGPWGMRARLASNPEAQREWTMAEIVVLKEAGGIAGVFEEIEAWCQSVLDHLGIEVPVGEDRFLSHLRPEDS